MSIIKEITNLEFILHGVKQTLDTKGLSPEITLNDYLRNTLRLTGTKYMCREGGCGVCIVTARIKNPRTGVKEVFAVNSCLVSILSCAGWDITTVEGLGNREDGYNPIQQKIVEFNGTQCGFCTPGMIMNMHALVESGKLKMAEIENSFGGNLCRCTGYRPILSAFKSMATDSDKNVLGSIPDIEELKICRKESCSRSCPTPCTADFSEPVVYDLGSTFTVNGIPEPNGKNWYKVTALEDIFQVFKLRPERNYKLVAGNTARGVYWDMRDADYYIDITQIQDLRYYEHDTSKLLLGGNFTITEMMAVFTEVANKDDNFKHLKKAVHHLDLIATVPVRNIGTIAGNLTIKHLHNEFPSDIFLILEVIKATLILDNGSQEQTVTPQEYLASTMHHRIIKRILIPSLDSSYKYGSYKIMPKSQNAHAHINAGFLFKLKDKSVVEDARIVFGGINPSFVHATAAEKLITGKQLFNNTNMQKLFEKLNGELMPDCILPDPTPEFRKQLAIALTYKFILSIASGKIITPMNKSGGQKLLRPAVSQGTQDYKTHESLYPIGKAINKIEAADQASGAAEYIIDMPDYPHQLYAAFVLAQAAAGSTIKSIDASEAMKLDGVEGFFQASDVLAMGGQNTFTPPHTLLPEQEILFVPINGKVQYYYQPVGVIAATSQRLAEQAADLVNVEYGNATTSPLLSVRDVISHNETSRIMHDTTIVAKRQDLDVPNKLKGTFDTNWQYHYHMECQIVNARPDDNGGLVLFPSTQWMDNVQGAICGALNVPANKITISVKRLGGSYGAKITRNNLIAVAAALVVLKLRKPIKFWLPLHVNMNVIGKRNPTSADYEVGYDNDGKLGFLNYAVYTNIGAHGNESPKAPLLDLMLHTYNSDGLQIDYNYVRTDNHAAVYTRAPGSVEGVAMMESVMEHVAYALCKDPLDVKLANLNTKEHPLLGKLMDDFLIWTDFRKRQTEIEAFNKDNRWRKRGIGLVPMVYGLEFVGADYSQVSIYHSDGTVAISHGGIEMGQGLNTKVVQVAAFCLGVDLSLISIKPCNNFAASNNFATGGSQSSEAICMATQKACDVLLKRIQDAAVATKLPDEAPWPLKVKNAFAIGTKLTQVEVFVANPASNYPIYGISAAEVEVDILTGNNIIQRVDLLEDVGHSISPIIDIGQVEGAYVMGIGYWTTEEYVQDHDGRLMTNRTWTYKPPGIKDIPVDFRVKFPDEPNPISPFKTKATGEPPLCTAVAVPLAIRQALKSAQQNVDTKAGLWLPINGPCTVEWTFMNALNSYKDYKL